MPSVKPENLDTEVSHDLDAANLKTVVEVQDRPSVDYGREGVGWIESRSLAFDHLGDPRRGDPTGATTNNQHQFDCFRKPGSDPARHIQATSGRAAVTRHQ
jgi:hypothetical protein